MRSSHANAGQATVEYVGIVVVVALVLAAFGAWAIHHVRAPDRPPPVVTAVIDPFAVVGRQEESAPGRGERLRRFIRQGMRGAVRGGRIVGRGWLAFNEGVTNGLAATVRDFVRDPVGSLIGGTGLLADVIRDPSGVGSAVVREAIDYAEELRAMPPEDAYERFMHDLGEVTADAAVTRGKAAARKALLRAIRRRLAHPRAPDHAR